MILPPFPPKRLMHTRVAAMKTETSLDPKYLPAHACHAKFVSARNTLSCGLKRPIERKLRVHTLAAEVGQPNLENLIRRFLYDQLHQGHGPPPDIDINMCP